MNIGICGGTFDPFHRGHLDPILAVCERARWDRVLYIPAHIQPFKQDRDTASGYDRFAMISLSILEEEKLFVSPVELERGNISYTVDTLETVRQFYPNAVLDWIIGDDNLAQLPEWKSIDRIFKLANFVVLTRGGKSVPPAMQIRVTTIEERRSHGSIAFAENPTVPISSTEIRKRLHDGQSIEDLVPPPVSRYIHHYGLYRKGQS
jgi:nicotinate-nucleotide adenylyltransferase